MKTKTSLNHETPPAAKPLLSAGFRSKREQKLFSKLLTYAVIYQGGGEWDEGVITETQEYCKKQVRRLGLPDGWQRFGSYEELKQWFFQACR